MAKTFSRRGGFAKRQTPYRSGLEDDIAIQLKYVGIEADYEKYSVSYSIPESKHIYTPDFILPNGIIIEAKGIFDTADRQKHLLIQKQHPELDIRFVFSNPNTKLYKGSKTSYAAWCTKHGFQYASKFIPESWLKDKKKRDLTALYRKGGGKG